MFINDIPFELFLDSIMPHLCLLDIQKLRLISKGIKEFCNHNQIWKELYIRRKVRDFYEKEITYHIRKLSLNTMPPEEGPRKKVHLSFHNNSNITTYIIYWRTSSGLFKIYYKVLPKQTRIIHSYIKHKWIIIPEEFSDFIEEGVFVTTRHRRYNKRSQGKWLKDIRIFEEDKLYITKTVFPLNDDIEPRPLISYNNGTKRVFNNPIHINLGDEYYSGSKTKKLFNLPLPTKTRNFTDFRKRLLNIYLPKIKKNLQEKKKEKNNLDKEAMILSKEVEELQNKVLINNHNIKETSNSIQNMNIAIEMINNMKEKSNV